MAISIDIAGTLYLIPEEGDTYAWAPGVTNALQAFANNNVFVQDIVDNLVTANALRPLSANQGVELKEDIDLLTNPVYTITAGMSSAQIVAIFDEAQTIKNTGATIQFSDSLLYTLSQNYTFTGCSNLRILGNSANTGNTDNKAVAININGDYRLTFVDCDNVEIRYLKFDTEIDTGSLFNLTNSRVNVLDCYNVNDDAGAGVDLARTNKGSHFYLQDSSIIDYTYVGNAVGGYWEYATGNSVSGVSTDPYFNNSGGIVIDIDGALVASDLGGGYTYKALGYTTASNIVRGARFKGLQGTNDDWDISMYSADASASTLADYEEGNWTPILVPASGAFGAITYDTLRLGKYRKVGRVCTIECTMKTDSITVSTASGDLRIGGLPFSADSDSYASGTVSQSALWDTNDNPLACEIIPSTTTVQLYRRPTFNGDSTPSQVGDLLLTNDKNFLRFTMSYRTAS